LECEFVHTDGSCKLTLRIDEMGHQTIDDLRQFLGESFISLTVIPEGMAFMPTAIQFRN
jgi:hypothetical protein